ncbi:MAG TPA: PAS domain S-box protein [bacterium]|nr:PAS domain S-box protein [bacterium]
MPKSLLNTNKVKSVSRRNVLLSILLVFTIIVIIWTTFFLVFVHSKKDTLTMYRERQYMVMYLTGDIRDAISQKTGGYGLGIIESFVKTMNDDMPDSIRKRLDDSSSSDIEKRMYGYGNMMVIYGGKVVFVNGSLESDFTAENDGYGTSNQVLKEYLDRHKDAVSYKSEKESLESVQLRIDGKNYTLTSGMFQLAKKPMTLILYADDNSILDSYGFYTRVKNYFVMCFVVTLAVLIVSFFFIRSIIDQATKNLRLIQMTSKLRNEMEERRRAQTALVDSEKRYRDMIETTTDIIWQVDRDIRYTYISPQVSELLGYKLSELIGKTPFEKMEAEESKRIKKEIAPVLEARQSFFRRQNRNVGKDGIEVMLETSAAPFFDEDGEFMGYRGIDRDITERVVAQEALRKSEQEFRLLFENSTDAIFWADPGTGRIINCNHSAEKLLKKSREDIIGLHQSELHPEEQNEYHREIFNTHVKNSGGMNKESRVITSDGEVIPVHISATVAEINDRKILQGIFRDIRDLKVTELEKESLQQQLHHMQKMDAIGRLAGGIAHDFNNILAVMIGAAELAKKTIDPESKAGRRLQSVTRAGLRAKQLTMKLLTLARKDKLELDYFTCNELIEEVIDMLKRSIPKQVKFVNSLKGEKLTIKVDSSQIIQAILNICINASDAMPDGGVLTIENSPVVLDENFCRAVPALTPGRYCRISVSDTGCGMSEEVKSKIFDPFFTTKGKEKGTGLGLSITMGIVRSHDGYIEVESEEGKGTTFFVYLPVSDDLTAGEIRRSDSVETGEAGGMVFVIDDDEDYLAMISEALENEGYSTITAKSGDEALAAFERLRESVDVILLDMMMPDMDGTETFFRLRELDPECRVVICSGYSKEGKASELLENGALAYIQKPFELYEILSVVEKIIAS